MSLPNGILCLCDQVSDYLLTEEKEKNLKMLIVFHQKSIFWFSVQQESRMQIWLVL